MASCRKGLGWPRLPVPTGCRTLCTIATLCRLKGTTQRSRPACATQHAPTVTDSCAAQGAACYPGALGPCCHIPRGWERGEEHFSYQETEVLKDGPLVRLVRGTCGTSLMRSGDAGSSPSSVTLRPVLSLPFNFTCLSLPQSVNRLSRTMDGSPDSPST